VDGVVEEIYVWDGWQMIGVRNGAGEHLERRYHYPWIDGIRSKVIGTSVPIPQTFYFKDYPGSITEEKGYNVSLKRFRYDSFGNTVYEQDGTRYEEIRFTGREYFPEMVLYYFCNRWYDPRVGRFVSEDPALYLVANLSISEDFSSSRYISLSFNPYTYTENNPLHYKDPMGLWIYVPGTTGPRGLYPHRFTFKCKEPCCRSFGECWLKCFEKYYKLNVIGGVLAGGEGAGVIIGSVTMLCIPACMCPCGFEKQNLRLNR